MHRSQIKVNSEAFQGFEIKRGVYAQRECFIVAA